MFFVIFETDQAGIRYTVLRFTTIHIKLEVHLSLYYSKNKKSSVYYQMVTLIERGQNVFLFTLFHVKMFSWIGDHLQQISSMTVDVKILQPFSAGISQYKHEKQRICFPWNLLKSAN